MHTWIWCSLTSSLYSVSLTGTSDGWGDRGRWQWWGRRRRPWGPGSRCSPWAELPHHRVVLHQHLLHLAHPRGTTPPGQLDGPHPFCPTSQIPPHPPVPLPSGTQVSQFPPSSSQSWITPLHPGSTPASRRQTSSKLPTNGLKLKTGSSEVKEQKQWVLQAGGRIKLTF